MTTLSCHVNLQFCNNAHWVKEFLTYVISTNKVSTNAIIAYANWVIEFLNLMPIIIKAFSRPTEFAPSDLQPHYGNGVFGNVYNLALDDTKR